MFFRASDQPSKVKFRPLFKTLLESLRVDIVGLHNEIGDLDKKHPQTYNSESIANLLQSLKLLEGENNFVNQIENMKRDVTHTTKISVSKMVQNFNLLKIELVSVLNARIATETNDNTVKTPVSEILQKCVGEIDKNKITLDGTKVNFILSSASRESTAPLSGNYRPPRSRM